MVHIESFFALSKSGMTAKKRLSFIGVGVAVLLCLWTQSLQATIFDAPPIDLFFYGTLKQSNTTCPAFGCGPTAVVNSFVWLQAEHPEIYGTKLVPTVDPTNPTQREQAAVANMLLPLMHTDPNRGTYWSWLLSGKEAYINDKAPGTTRYAAQSKFDWVGDSGNTNPKPSYAQDNLPNGPSIGFLFRELLDHEDVEILIGGHWVTLIGARYDTENLEGTLTYIDPFDGQSHDANIVQEVENGPIFFDYNGQTVTVDVAVAESVPGPVTIVLMGTGVLVLCWASFIQKISVLIGGWRGNAGRSKPLRRHGPAAREGLDASTP